MKLGYKKGDLFVSLHIMELATIGLTVLAVGLGIVVYGKLGGNPMEQKSTTQEGQVKTPTTAQAPAISLPQEFLESEYFKSLTKDEQGALRVPGPTSSEKEKQAHYGMAVHAAKDVTVMEVARCEIKPVVLRIKEGGEITLKNSNNMTHTITLDPAHTYPVPANGEVVVTARFDRGAGLYGFGCDAHTSGRGFFLIAK